MYTLGRGGLRKRLCRRDFWEKTTNNNILYMTSLCPAKTLIIFRKLQCEYSILYLVPSIEEGKDRSEGKGRRFCLGGEFIQFLAALTILPWGWFWRIGWIHPFLSNHSGATHGIIKIVLDKTASAARNFLNSTPQTQATTFALLLSLSFFYGPLPPDWGVLIT